MEVRLTGRDIDRGVRLMEGAVLMDVQVDAVAVLTEVPG